MLSAVWALYFSMATASRASAQADMDATSAVLLRSSGKSVAPEELDSSLYKVRVPESRPVDEVGDADEDRPGRMVPAPVPPKAPRSRTKGASMPAPQAPVLDQAPPPATIVPTPSPPVSAQVTGLLLGGSSDEIDEYRRQVHPDDPRSNFLDITFAPAYFYKDSGSEFSYRRYHAHGPGFGAGMSLWLTPFFGIRSGYFSSVTGGVRGSGINQVPLTVQVFEAGFRFRKHFGFSRRAPFLTWGLDYHDAGDRISRESTVNVGSRSSGLSAALEAQIPSSNGYANTFAISIQPRLHHSEPATGAQVRSGTKNETNAISLSLGGEWVLDRRNQIFWRGQYGVSRSLFQGEASAPDARTGQTPSGVTVTESLVLFYFGFKWGS